MTIPITVYDKGMVEVDDAPMNGDRWLSAATVVAQKVEFLNREQAARLKGRPAG